MNKNPFINKDNFYDFGSINEYIFYMNNEDFTKYYDSTEFKKFLKSLYRIRKRINPKKIYSITCILITPNGGFIINNYDIKITIKSPNLKILSLVLNLYVNKCIKDNKLEEFINSSNLIISFKEWKPEDDLFSNIKINKSLQTILENKKSVKDSLRININNQ